MHFTHKQGSAEYLILALPNEAENVALSFNKINFNVKDTIYFDSIDLPPNNYEIIYSGLLDEASEEVAELLVSYYKDPFTEYCYDIDKITYFSPIPCFKHIIRSKGWFLENPHGNMSFNSNMDWHVAQQKVVNKIAILKIV